MRIPASGQAQPATGGWISGLLAPLVPREAAAGRRTVDEVDFFDIPTLEELQREYVASLPEKVEKLTVQRERLPALPWSRESLAELRTEAHRLAGSGGAYGFPSITDAARALQGAIDAYASDPASADAGRIDSRLAALKQVLSDIPDQSWGSAE